MILQNKSHKIKQYSCYTNQAVFYKTLSLVQDQRRNLIRASGVPDYQLARYYNKGWLSCNTLQEFCKNFVIRKFFAEVSVRTVFIGCVFSSTHALQEVQQSMKQTEKEDTLSLQRKRLRHELTIIAINFVHKSN